MATWELTEADQEMIAHRGSAIPARPSSTRTRTCSAPSTTPGTRPAHQQGNPASLG